MSLNIACIYAHADRFVVKSILNDYLTEFSCYESVIVKTLQDNIEKYYLNSKLQREMVLTPDIEGWVGIIEGCRFGIDPQLAKSISAQLSCRTIWIEYIESSYSLIIGEFDCGRFIIKHQLPEKTIREGLYSFFNENLLEFDSNSTKIPDFQPINLPLIEYLQKSDVPVLLWNLIRSSRKSVYIGESFILDNSGITEEGIFFKQIENPWSNLQHLDFYGNNDSINEEDEPKHQLNIEHRKIKGVISSKASNERLYLLEESWRKRIFFIFSQNDEEQFIPEVRFDYHATEDLNTLIDNERDAHKFGFWRVTDKYPRLTLKGFSDYVFSWLETTYPHLSIEIDRENKSIKWVRDNGGSLICAYLDNLYLKYILDTPEKEIDKILSEHFAPMIKLPEDIIDRDGLDTDPGRDVVEYFDVRLLNEKLLSKTYDNYVYQYYLENIRAYVGYDFGYGAFRFLLKDDLVKLGYKFDEILEFALQNIRMKFHNLADQFEMISDDETQITYYKLGNMTEIDSTIVLLPEFPSLVRQIVGEQFYVGIPSRDIVYIYPDADKDFLRRRKRELRFLYDVAPYPIISELIQIDELGSSIFELEDYFEI